MLEEAWTKLRTAFYRVRDHKNQSKITANRANIGLKRFRRTDQLPNNRMALLPSKTIATTGPADKNLPNDPEYFAEDSD